MLGKAFIVFMSSKGGDSYWGLDIRLSASLVCSVTACSPSSAQ